MNITVVENQSQRSITELRGLHWLKHVDPRFEEKTIDQLWASLHSKTNLRLQMTHRRLYMQDRNANAKMAEVVRERLPDIETFVQVGAHNGYFDDPFRELIHEQGWRAILIEPQVEVFKQLEEQYRDVDRVTCIRTAIGATCGSLALYKAVLANRYDFGTAIATTDRNQVISEVGRCLGKKATRGLKIESEEVTMSTLSEALGDVHPAMGTVDFLASDTEGYDAVVVRQALTDCGMQPSLIQFEHLHVDPRQTDDLRKELRVRGYQTVDGHHKDTLAYLV